MKTKVAIYPSLISGNLLRLFDQIKLLEPYCTGFHIDVMDFHFVPNLTWGPEFINQIRKATKKRLFIHLMVDYPEKYFDRLELDKKDVIAIHLESKSSFSVKQLIEQIKYKSCLPSIALNPKTPLQNLWAIDSPIEQVLLMSVNPGFSGQKFIPMVFQKLQALNNYRATENLSFKISMDGGITHEIIDRLIYSGADSFAVANAIFNAPDPVESLIELTKTYNYE